MAKMRLSRSLAVAALLALASCNVTPPHSKDEIVQLDCEGVMVLGSETSQVRSTFSFNTRTGRMWEWSERERDWVDICSNLDCSVEINDDIIRVKKGYAFKETEYWIDRVSGQWSAWKNGFCKVANPQVDSPNVSTNPQAQPNLLTNFKRVRLPRGVSLDVPEGWWMLDDEFTKMLHTSTEAVLDLTSMPLDSGGGVETDLLRANSMPRSTFASVAVTSLVPPSARPDELRALRNAELIEFEGVLNASLRETLPMQGLKMLGQGTARIGSVSGYPALITEYRRTGQNGPVAVQMLQIMTDQQEVKVVLSYREVEAAIWAPVIEVMRKSIAINELTDGASKF